MRAIAPKFKSTSPRFRNYLFIIVFFYFLISWYIFDVTKERVKEISRHEILIGTQKRPYYISSSEKELKGKKAPLIIFLHGMDNSWPEKNSTKLQYNYIDTLSSKQNFIAVFPRGSLGSCDWENNKYSSYYCWSTREEYDRFFIRKLKEEVENNYGTDPEKAFLVGFSNGGYFVMSYLLRHHDADFSGYGIHSGGGYLFKNEPVFDYHGKLPVFMSVGNKDPYELESMRNLKNSLLKLGWKLNSNLDYSEFEGGHSLSKDELKKEVEFFLDKY